MTRIATPLMHGTHVQQVRCIQPVCFRVSSFSTNSANKVEKGKENIKNTAQDAAETAQKSLHINLHGTKNIDLQKQSN